jgi:hypothetical protein
MQNAPDISSSSEGPGSSSVHSSDDRRTRRKLRRVRLSAIERRSATIDKGTISGISRDSCGRVRVSILVISEAVPRDRKLPSRHFGRSARMKSRFQT